MGLKSGHHDDAFYACLWSTIRAGRVWRGEMVNRRKDRTVYFEEQSITPVRANGGRAGGISHFGAPSLKKPFALGDVRAALAQVPPAAAGA